MADTQKLAERMMSVYQACTTADGVVPSPVGNPDVRVSDLDATYLLHFNKVAVGGRLHRAGKRILQWLTWPILRHQVTFNGVVREILRNQGSSINGLEAQIRQFREAQNRPEKAAETADPDVLLCSPVEIEKAGTRSHWVRTTERILEHGFVHHAIARLGKEGAEILDVGAAESLLSFELASLGYSVTAVDVRDYPFTHPNLRFLRCNICSTVLPNETFDCAIALSTVEHIGLGFYGDPSGDELDKVAMRRLWEVLKPAGKLVLTVPYGKRAVTPLHRIYDGAALCQLIDGFRIERAVYGVRVDDRTWLLADESAASTCVHDPADYRPGAVAMFVCEKVAYGLC